MSCEKLKASEMMFHDWVLQKYTKKDGHYKDCPGGDLAEDFARDSWFREEKNEDADIFDINEHMLNKHSCWEAIRTLYECYTVYHREVMADFGLNEYGHREWKGE